MAGEPTARDFYSVKAYEALEADREVQVSSTALFDAIAVRTGEELAAAAERSAQAHAAKPVWKRTAQYVAAHVKDVVDSVAQTSPGNQTLSGEVDIYKSAWRTGTLEATANSPTIADVKATFGPDIAAQIDSVRTDLAVLFRALDNDRDAGQKLTSTRYIDPEEFDGGALRNLGLDFGRMSDALPNLARQSRSGLPMPDWSALATQLEAANDTRLFAEFQQIRSDTRLALMGARTQFESFENGSLTEVDIRRSLQDRLPQLAVAAKSGDLRAAWNDLSEGARDGMVQMISHLASASRGGPGRTQLLAAAHEVIESPGFAELSATDAAAERWGMDMHAAFITPEISAPSLSKGSVAD